MKTGGPAAKPARGPFWRNAPASQATAWAWAGKEPSHLGRIWPAPSPAAHGRSWSLDTIRRPSVILAGSKRGGRRHPRETLAHLTSSLLSAHRAAAATAWPCPCRRLAGDGEERHGRHMAGVLPFSFLLSFPFPFSLHGAAAPTERRRWRPERTAAPPRTPSLASAFALARGCRRQAALLRCSSQRVHPASRR